MAYPDSIKKTGPLSLQDDIFNYFKGGLLNSNSTSVNRERWPIMPSYTIPGTNPPIEVAGKYFLTGSFGTSLTFPCTRGDFYDYIDSFTITTASTDGTVNFSQYFFRTIHGGKLYQFSDVQGNANWPEEAVTNWGKIKTLELALFGSVGNGGSLTTSSVVGSGSFTSRVSEMKICSLNYLRYGLCRFRTHGDFIAPPYGSCHPASVAGPALTYVNDDITFRRFIFNIPSGILVGDLEVSTNSGSAYGNVTGASQVGNQVLWPVPSGVYPPGTIKMRVRRSRGAYIEEGPTIQNQIIYT